MRRIDTYKSSGEITSSKLIKAGAGFLGGVIIATDKTNDAAVTLYDNTSASGTKLTPTIDVPGSDHYGGMMFSGPIEFSNGCYISVSGTGASCVVYYR